MMVPQMPPAGGATLPPGAAAGPATGLGFAAAQGTAGGGLEAEILQLKQVMEELRMRETSATAKADPDKKDKSKKKKKEEAKKRRKKKKAKGSTEVSSASSSASKTSESSTSSRSSQSSGDKHLAWTVAKKRRITSAQVVAANSVRFRKRGDLLNFHYKHPGGLAALFLWQVRQRLGGEQPKDTEALRRVDASSWANLYSGVKELRDQREVAFMCKLLLELGHKRYGHAVDLMAMRVREILMAKKDGSSWEKASLISLLPGSHGAHSLIPDGAFVA